MIATEMTIKDRIYFAMFKTGKPLAEHELPDAYRAMTGEPISANGSNISRRLREMALEYYHPDTGNRVYIKGRKRADENFHEWYITTKEEYFNPELI